MTTYTAVWTWTWFAVLSVVAAVGALTAGVRPVLLAFAIGAAVTTCLGVGLEEASGDGTLAGRLRVVRGPALWSGGVLVALVTLSAWHSSIGLGVVVAVLVSSPYVVRRAVARWRPAARSGSATSRQVRRMTFSELNTAWLETERALALARPAQVTLQVVLRREQLIDEMERRGWLTLREGGGPEGGGLRRSP